MESNLSTPVVSPGNDAKQTSKRIVSTAEIQNWIAAYLADLLETDPEDIDITLPFDRYGLDSSVAIGLTGDLEDWLGTKLDPTLLYDYPTVAALSKHLAAELA
ncbi:MAG: acyl carrier protein [Oculatellaceae cyanobacterium Prado106]|jgi:acyl carrier protein|nr:acyl carrier protein [Oculatellaceae cyanobacterium Prado106]